MCDMKFSEVSAIVNSYRTFQKKLEFEDFHLAQHFSQLILALFLRVRVRWSAAILRRYVGCQNFMYICYVMLCRNSFSLRTCTSNTSLSRRSGDATARNFQI
jgi:hypothetical protein